MGLPVFAEYPSAEERVEEAIFLTREIENAIADQGLESACCGSCVGEFRASQEVCGIHVLTADFGDGDQGFELVAGQAGGLEFENAAFLFIDFAEGGFQVLGGEGVARFADVPESGAKLLDIARDAVGELKDLVKKGACGGAMSKSETAGEEGCEIFVGDGTDGQCPGGFEKWAGRVGKEVGDVGADAAGEDKGGVGKKLDAGAEEGEGLVGGRELADVLEFVKHDKERSGGGGFFDDGEDIGEGLGVFGEASVDRYDRHPVFGIEGKGGTQAGKKGEDAVRKGGG